MGGREGIPGQILEGVTIRESHATKPERKKARAVKRRRIRMEERDSDPAERMGENVGDEKVNGGGGDASREGRKQFPEIIRSSRQPACWGERVET